ncbi:mucin-16-like [Rhincodon typus]|uniref:mucin-16-like n=1 Tax=Rhincodon typus TaxID=259920 RepID=UPI00202FDFAB|nr:mucin-16-like [Rhincodon typus]
MESTREVLRSTARLAPSNSTESTTTSSSRPTAAVASTTSETTQASTRTVISETLTTSAETISAIVTTTSTPASTSSTPQTTESSSISTSTLESTPVSVQASTTSGNTTASTHTTTRAPSSELSLTSTSSSAPTTESSSTSTSAAESTTVSTSQGTTTSASTETLTASTQAIFTGPSSTSAAALTSTTAATTAENSTEALRTESTTMTATTLTTRESSSAETTSISVQTSTNFPVTSSAATATTSETSTTNTTHLLTVEPPIVPETDKPIQTQTKKFNVTFIVLSLPFTPVLQNLTSPLYLAESRNIIEKLNNLYANSKVNSTFLDCQPLSFRSANDGNSTVEAFCNFIKSANGQQVDEVQLYHEFRDNTQGITSLGNYSLDNNSLYVDGYHESSVLTTTTSAVTTTQTPNLGQKRIELNVTFVITNLEFIQSLQNSSSLLFNSTSNDVSGQLTALFNESKIKETFSDCKVVSFSLANGGSTSVYAICTFRNDSTAQEIDKVTVYHEFRDNTKNISTLRTYSLDNNSLYVNGYHESTPFPTVTPVVTTTQTPNVAEKPIEFNITFIITNLEFTENLQDSNSSLHNSTSDIIAHQLTTLLNKSKINETFLHCKVVSFSVANVANTSVYSICTFRNDSMQDFNRVTVYHEFRDNTNNISTLGIYSLDNNSLYVNGYHESTPFPTLPTALTTTQIPNVAERPIEFNVTFIITNLEFTQSLQDSSSLLYSSASDIISHQLNALFNRSKINATFSHCKVASFSLANIGNTSVYAICSFRNDSTAQEIDKVTVYHEFRDNTKNISTLGMYSLDNNSLYVNGYHEPIPLPTITPEVTTTQTPSLEEQFIEFNVTFVITNLKFTQPLQDSNSLLFKSASNIISHQLTELYGKSKINSTFLTCETVSFRPTNIGSSSVYSICKFRNESTPEKVDKVIAYNVFRNNTKNISILGAYSLDNNSLYVNGYHETIPLPTPFVTTTPNPQAESFDFNVTFIITNLVSTANLISPNSALHKSASSIINFQLNNLFKNSNINRTFSSCKVQSFSPANAASTSVYTICTFTNGSNPQDVNRVTAYHEIRDNTKDISTLGAYSLDSNSLYVNGYHEEAPSASPSVTTTPNLQPQSFDFNVTVIITNLPTTANLISPNSALHKSASNIIAYQLNNLFRNSNISKTFSSCKVQSFSPANDASTSVYTICTFTNDSNPQDVNRVTAYHEIRDNTKDISTLGAYSLDSNSLYVNGYHEETPSATPFVATTPNLQTNSFEFNVTFIITNLVPTSNLISSNSALHKSASNIIAYQLNDLFTNSNINKTFSSCKVQSFSPANAASTSVYTICTFTNDSNPREVNRVSAYREIRNNTKDISTLGAYSLDSNSLYVNGYHEAAPSAPPFVATTPNLQPKSFDFSVTFTITNLVPITNLISSNSALHKSASNIIAYQLNDLFTNSNINKTFSSCKVQSFSPANDASTSVYTICTFTNDSNPQDVNRVTAYHEIRDNTKDISTLGAYSLDSNSLYVNGYHESTPLITEAPVEVVTLQPNKEIKPIDFNVTFTINNLEFKSELQNINSAEYTTTSSNVISLLNNLYKSSKVNETFTNCELVSFSSANQGNSKVEARCSFKNNPTIPGVDKVIVYNEFRDNTEKITALGIYALNKDSLYVDGYHELEPTTAPTILSPEVREGDLPFELNFTIINRNFTEALNDPNSREYQSIVANVTKMLEELYKNSALKDSYRFCKVTGLRIGSVKCICTCYFDPSAVNEPVIAEQVKAEFAMGTNSTNLLGNVYQLRNTSLAVEAKAPVSSDRTEIPYWAIILIVLGILLILFLLFLFCLLITLCLKKKFHGSYNMMQHPTGLYFPHQKFY